MKKSVKITLSIIGLVFLAALAVAIILTVFDTSTSEDDLNTSSDGGLFQNEGTLGEALLQEDASIEEIALVKINDAETLTAQGKYEEALAKIAEVQDKLSGELLVDSYRVQLAVYLRQDKIDEAILVVEKVLATDVVSGNPAYKKAWEDSLAQLKRGENPVKETDTEREIELDGDENAL